MPGRRPTAPSGVFVCSGRDDGLVEAVDPRTKARWAGIPRQAAGHSPQLSVQTDDELRDVAHRVVETGESQLG